MKKVNKALIDYTLVPDWFLIEQRIETSKRVILDQHILHESDRKESYIDFHFSSIEVDKNKLLNFYN